jgi:hypothetical protein
MTDKQRLESLPRSARRDVEIERDLMSASAAGLRLQEWQEEQEGEWESRLSDLQLCICELLMKNQQLRWLLEPEANHRCGELANDSD